MDVNIPNMTELNIAQAPNPTLETVLQTKKVSLEELAQATEVLRKYIYQQTKKEVQVQETKPIVNEIQLAEQPVIDNDVLSEEAPLTYENISVSTNDNVLNAVNVITENISVENNLIEDTPPVISGNPGVIPVDTPVINEELTNETINTDPIITEVVQTEPQSVDITPVVENTSVDNFTIPVNISIPTLDDISQPFADSQAVDNATYVATSNIAKVNSDFNSSAPEVAPVTMPDGQFVQESIGEDSLVTSPQSFGMM